MKNFIILCITTLFMSCAQNNPENTEATTTRITKPQKTDIVTDKTTKIEVLLDKGGTVTMVSEENIILAKNKKYLDKITVYKIIANSTDRSTNWIIDTKSPLTKIDTTFLCCGEYGLKKLQYRQGYISAIYE